MFIYRDNLLLCKLLLVSKHTLKKYFTPLLWLCLFFLLKTAASQNPLEYSRQISKNLSGETLRKKIDSLIVVCEEEGLFEFKEEIAFIYALGHTRPGLFNTAIEYGKIAVEAGEQLGPKGANHLGVVHNVGKFHIDNRQYEDAIKYFNKIIEIDTIPGLSGEAYSELGNCYRYMGDYYRSVDFYNKGIQVFERLGILQAIAVHSINLAWAYELINTKESLAKRMEVLMRADSIVSLIQLDEYNYLKLKNSIANQYTRKGYYDFDKSRDIYFNNINRGIQNADTATLSMTYNNLAYLYNLEQRDSAKYWVEEGLKVVTFPEDHARLYDNLSDYHLHRNEFEQAFEYIHKAMEISLNAKVPLKEAPTELQLHNANAKDYLMYCLHQKSEILNKLYAQNGDSENLRNIIKQVQAGDLLSQTISGRSNSINSKYYWRNEASSLYHLGAEAATLLGHTETAFYFTEKNKAILLAEEIAENTLAAELPDHLAIRERMLKGRILSLEASGEEAEGLFAAKNDYSQLKDSIEQFYPEFIKSQTQIEIKDLKEVQESLKSDQLMISYIWNRPDFSQEKIIGLAITKDEVKTFDIIVDEAWQNQLKTYRDLVSRPLQTQEELSAFNKTSHAMYEALIPEQVRSGDALPDELLIVPDGALQNLPFEALITNADNSQYLMEQSDVYYLYSYSFLKYNQQRVRKKTEGKLLAYAPVEFQEEGLASLPYSGKEAEAVATALNGEVRLNGAASKASFLNQSQDYEVLHLATHADGGEDHWIAFSDEKLNLYELYTYENNANLVVLSGCNTLLGEVVSGEGVLSLARGFFYSGSETVIASLWSTNDFAMSEIMTHFYENLSDGQGKAKALNNAKRQYLAAHNLSEKSPYYWAAPLLIGDPDELDKGLPNVVYGLMALVILIAVVARRRVARKSA